MMNPLLETLSLYLYIYIYIYILYDTMMHNNYNDKTSIRFALTNDTPYLVLTGEAWGVFRELYG